MPNGFLRRRIVRRLSREKTARHIKENKTAAYSSKSVPRRCLPREAPFVISSPSYPPFQESRQCDLTREPKRPLKRISPLHICYTGDACFLPLSRKPPNVTSRTAFRPHRRLTNHASTLACFQTYTRTVSEKHRTVPRAHASLPEYSQGRTRCAEKRFITSFYSKQGVRMGYQIPTACSLTRVVSVRLLKRTNRRCYFTSWSSRRLLYNYRSLSQKVCAQNDRRVLVKT